MQIIHQLGKKGFFPNNGVYKRNFQKKKNSFLYLSDHLGYKITFNQKQHFIYQPKIFYKADVFS